MGRAGAAATGIVLASAIVVVVTEVLGALVTVTVTEVLGAPVTAAPTAAVPE